MLTFMSPYSKILAERIAEKKKKIFICMWASLYANIMYYKKERVCCIYTQKSSNKHKKYGCLK